jgi:uncharacterized protein HemX
VAAFFLRWGPPLIGVAFASGLQLSGATQHFIGWALIAAAFIGSGLYVFVERRLERRKAEAQAKHRRREAQKAKEQREQRFSKYAYLMSPEQKAELLPKRKGRRVKPEG